MLHRAAIVIALVGLFLASPATAEENLSVSVDRAKVVKIDRPAETIIVGNPSIVDVAVHDARTLILTGRSYGVTNLVVLDARGEPVVDHGVIVGNTETASVRIYRQASRSTYSCSPTCEPTLAIGDAPNAFEVTAEQFSVREGLARGASGQ